MIDSAFASLTSHAGVFLQSNNNDIPEDFPMALGIFLACASVSLFAMISVFAWQFGATWRAKMLVARDEAYKEIAHRSALSMERTAARLDEQSNTLSSLQTRVSEIERVLKDVG